MDISTNLLDFVLSIIDFILHIDVHLTYLVSRYGAWVYAILFLIIFCETGLVVTPFLPGDSLLFVAGALAALGNLNVHLVVLLLLIAAILGDGVNYFIGKYLGQYLFKRFPRLLKPQYLEKTQQFYEKYGGKTIIIARFIPVIRTFAPFVAGIGHMTYSRFLMYNVIGAIIWVFGFSYAGYFFGNLPFVQKNLEFLVIAIIFVSILPAIIEFLRQYRKAKKA